MTITCPETPDAEALIPINAVPTTVQQRYGISITRQTAYNWITRGRRSVHGGTVKLRYLSRFGRRFTTPKMIEEFAQEL